jgi:hypothetical protein
MYRSDPGSNNDPKPPLFKAKGKKLSKKLLGPAQRKERLFCLNIVFEMLVFNSIVIRLLI